MNQYEYLAGTHDLSLSDWGPYARNYYALSHLADKVKGTRFDYFMVPGIYRREVFPPDTLKESGFSPREVSPDLNYYSYRQDIEGKDELFADISYSRIDDDTRMGRCKFVNNSDTEATMTLHHFAGIFFNYQDELLPVLTESSRWIAAVDYAKLEFGKPGHDDALTWDGRCRGEELMVHGSVNGHSIGKSIAAKPRHRFGFDVNDRISFKIDSGFDKGFIQLRFLLKTGTKLKFKIKNASEQEVELAGSGKFETVVIYSGNITPGMLDIVSLGGEEIILDGIIIGKAGDENKTSFAPANLDNKPNVEDGPVENSSFISYNGMDHVYGLWWSVDKYFKRYISTDNIMDTLIHSYPIRNPFFPNINLGHKEKFAELYMLPITVEAHSSLVIYSVIGNGSRNAVSEKFKALQLDAESLEKVYENNRKTAITFNTTDEGRKFAYGQQLMAATALTNITYPIYVKRSMIKHHTPARFYNSLYTWDSGFIGLGLLELDKKRAIENLNVYVTEPGDNESAFILHGTPLPVQAYLYEEIWNRFQDKDALEFFYPRLRQYYDFLAGKLNSSNTARFKSGLLNSWDYFYNSGGWDDYPPQWEIHLKKHRHISPAINNAEAIRFAKILTMAATELGITDDLPVYAQDIEKFTTALQKYSWDETCGYFSYVIHDENDKPTGFFRDTNGVNFNMGMDGLTPLIAGICTEQQQKILFDKLESPEHFFTPVGLSTVDKTAPYYRQDGYWNGSVWMPHQWFFWKSALDHGKTDFARNVALTALELWQKECAATNYCFEHFDITSGRGCMCHNFGGLSSPVMNWFNAYFTQGRLTGGFDTWIRKIEHSTKEHRFELTISGNSGENTTVLFVAGPGKFQTEYNGKRCKHTETISGTMEIVLPKNSKGNLTIKQIL